MTRAMVIGVLLLVGCGTEGPAMEPEADMSGTWSYTWSHDWVIQGQPSEFRGSLEMTQDGDSLIGQLAAPADIDPIDGGAWDWKFIGTKKNALLAVGPKCMCAVVPFSLSCQSTETSIACSVTQHDDYGDHGGSFIATR